MASPDFEPTLEQRAALTAFSSGDTFVLEAGAGTGKTATLQLLAESAPRRRGLYVAFNNAIAVEARKKFPSNITVKTTHALAMAGTEHTFQPRLRAPKIPLATVANRLGISAPVHIGLRNPLRPATQASLAMRTVVRWCSTDAETIGRRHVPRPEGMSKPAHAMIAPRIVELAGRVWADVSRPDGDQFRFEHDHYLKAWALERPRWGYDFILFDEAQDSSPVVSAMITDQIASGSQVVAVGDAAQAIYGWRGAVDALNAFGPSQRLRLSQSFRFGPAVAEEANAWLELLGLPMRLKGLSSLESRIIDGMRQPDAILCRTNSSVIGELFLALDRGEHVGLVGGTDDLLAVTWAAQALKSGRTTDHPEFALFSSWAELVEYAEDGNDPGLSTLIKIVDDHGPTAIEDAIQRATHVDSAKLVLSTVHKAKGREWERVRLARDFAEPRQVLGLTKLPSPDELMLSYVAVTRAQRELDRGNLAWASDHSPPSWLSQSPRATTAAVPLSLEQEMDAPEGPASRVAAEPSQVLATDKNPVLAPTLPPPMAAERHGTNEGGDVMPNLDPTSETTEALLEHLVRHEQQFVELAAVRRQRVADLEDQIRERVADIESQVAELRAEGIAVKAELATRLKPGDQASVRGGTVKVRAPNRKFDIDAAWEVLSPEQRSAAMAPNTVKVKSFLSSAQLNEFMLPGTGPPKIVVTLDTPKSDT